MQLTSGTSGGGERENSESKRLKFHGFTKAGECEYSCNKLPPPASAQTPAVSLSSAWPIDDSAFDTEEGSFIPETDLENSGPSMELLLDPNVPPSVVLMYQGGHEGFSLPSIEDTFDFGIGHPYFTMPAGPDYSFMTEDGIQLDDQAPTAGRPEATPVQPQSPPNTD